MDATRVGDGLRISPDLEPSVNADFSHSSLAMADTLYGGQGVIDPDSLKPPGLEMSFGAMSFEWLRHAYLELGARIGVPWAEVTRVMRGAALCMSPSPAVTRLGASTTCPMSANAY